MVVENPPKVLIIGGGIIGSFLKVYRLNHGLIVLVKYRSIIPAQGTMVTHYMTNTCSCEKHVRACNIVSWESRCLASKNKLGLQPIAEA